MKLFLFTFNVLLSLALSAQITYNGSSMAGLGDTVFLAEDTTHAAFVDLGNAAGNQTWDFTMLTEDKPDGAILEIPTSAPLSNLYPEADFVANDLYEDSIHLFFKKTETYLDVVGIVEYDSLGDPTPGFLDGSWRFMQFPTMMGTTFSSEVLSDTQVTELGIDFDSLGPDPYIDSIRTVITFSFYNEIDAWGTVQLPQGAYEAIRQRTRNILEFSSDCYYDSAWHSFTPLMLTYIDDESSDTLEEGMYRWWTDEPQVNLFVAEVEVDSNGMPDSNMSYTKETPLAHIGIREEAFTRIAVYPNPSVDVLNIDINDPIAGNVTLYDIRGRSVHTESFNGGSASVYIDHLPSGVYMLQISNTSGALVGLEKITINR